MGGRCSKHTSCRSKAKYRDNPTNKEAISTVKSSCQNMEDYKSLLSYISQRQWMFRPNSFISKDKFFFHYKEYLRDQMFASEVWGNVKVEQGLLQPPAAKRIHSQTILPKLKLLIRAGIPLDKLGQVILEIFQKTYSSNELEYSCALKVAFSGNTPETFKNVPLFSYSHQLEEVLPIHFLNREGLEAFKRIMWIYEKTAPELKYCPLVSQVVALLLLFLKEDETYCVVKEMLGRSEKFLFKTKNKEFMDRLKWHFTLTKEQFEVVLESMTHILKERVVELSKLWRHFKKLKYDCNDLFWQFLKTVFLEHFPLSLALKVFMAYLNEGIKVYYRFTFALLKIFEQELLEINDVHKITPFLKEKCSNLTKAQMQTLTNTAYSIRMSIVKKQLSSISLTQYHVPESAKLYLPQITDRSSVVTSLHFETVWEWLPHHLKLKKPRLTYSSKLHGWSLATLYSHLDTPSSEKELETLIFIKTTKSALFGAFIDGIPQKNGGAAVSIGSDESFVFQLEPEEKKYKATKKNRVHMVCDGEYLSIGSGGEGAAIHLMSDLLYGYSYKCATYDNKPLCHVKGHDDTYFECYAVELYLVDI